MQTAYICMAYTSTIFLHVYGQRHMHNDIRSYGLVLYQENNRALVAGDNHQSLNKREGRKDG
jgi:hypothetical protein